MPENTNTHHTPLTLPAALGDILSPNGLLASTFDTMGWAEEAISQAQRRHPAAANSLYHAFTLTRPTHNLMNGKTVYLAHVNELLTRVVAGQDTRPGTAAEMASVLHDASLVTPLNTTGAGLYFRVWYRAFPDHKHVIGNDTEHYEALRGTAIDDLDTELRQKLTRPDRTLTGTICHGRHHGETVDCTYASPTHGTAHQPQLI